MAHPVAGIRGCNPKGKRARDRRGRTHTSSAATGNDVGPPYEGYEGDFFGGGVFNGGGLTRIILSTVTANHAATSGGGVYSGADPGSGNALTVVKGSLIWGNTSGTDTPDDVAAFSSTDNEYQSLGYNLLGAAGSFAASFGGTGDATGITNALVGPLADNGGPTKTHALLAVSPALDTGTCRDHTNATVGTDQRGTTRPQSGYCDKGAFESSTFWSSCTYTAAAKNGARSVTVRWGNATPGVTKISVAGANPAEKVLAPSIGGSWTTSTRMVPTYGLWVGTSRKDTGTTLVAAGTACTAQ